MRKSDAILGKEIKCRDCGGQAVIYLEDHRYWVWCYTCRYLCLLKLYNIKPPTSPMEQLVLDAWCRAVGDIP